jgi:hypothetical protein
MISQVALSNSHSMSREYLITAALLTYLQTNLANVYKREGMRQAGRKDLA